MKRTRYLQQILASHTDPATMGKLMTVLVRCNKLSEIERLLTCLPNTKEYNDNEEITRAKITVAWNKKDVQAVYRLIEEGSFSNGEDLIEIWDQAHYYEADCRTALHRHRLRKRLVPPRSICPSGVRKKRRIPKDTIEALQAWLTDHSAYPTSTEKLMLAQQHRLTLGQLKNWFANVRRRLRRKTAGCPNLLQLRTRCKHNQKDVSASVDELDKYSSSLTSETSWPLVGDTPLVKQSSLPSFPNEIPRQLANVMPLDDQSGSPLFTSETPWKQDNVNLRPLVDESSSPLSPSELPWKLVDVIPSFDQSCLPKLSPNETEAFLSQSLSINHTNAAPTVMLNSVFNHTGLNPTVTSAPLVPFVVAGGQHQLSWLHNLVVFPPMPAAGFELNGFPAGLCVPGVFAGANPFQVMKRGSSETTS